MAQTALHLAVSIDFGKTLRLTIVEHVEDRTGGD